MPTYTVVCAEKSTGTTHALLIAGASEEDAAAKASSAGFLVSKTLLAIDAAETATRQERYHEAADAAAHATADTARQIKTIAASRIIYAPIGSIATAVLIGILIAMLLLSCLGFGLTSYLTNQQLADPTRGNYYGR